MNTLLNFIDWRGGTVNALKWYSRMISALAQREETPDKTEARLINMFLDGQELNQDETGGIGYINEEMQQFLLTFFDAWLKLTDDERCLLREFYVNDGSGTLNSVMRLCSILGYERTRIYELKKDAITKFTFLLFKHV